jgi:arabinan endo-1,5-alpha-L-arabinosidase
MVGAVFLVLLTGHRLSYADESDLAHLSRRDVRVHDPSTIVKCKDEYWVFSTGNGIPSMHSKDLVRWESGPVVFTNTPAWVAEAVPAQHRNEFWAPNIIHLSNQYLLYYSVSTWGKNTSAIGLATNPTLDPKDPKYRWTDRGMVIQSNARDDFNTIDPAITQDVHGKLWLAFGSYWSGIKLIALDPGTGKRSARDPAIHPLAHADSIEASYIYHHGKFYYLFVNWGQCCRGIKSTYSIRIGRSRAITGPYVDKDGVDMLHGGGSLFLGTENSFIGPGHAGIVTVGKTDWFSCHFYDGDYNGMAMLGIGQVRWGADGWPALMPVK